MHARPHKSKYSTDGQAKIESDIVYKGSIEGRLVTCRKRVEHKVRLEVQIWFRGNFEMKQSPRNAAVALRVDQTYLLTSETKQIFASL